MAGGHLGEGDIRVYKALTAAAAWMGYEELARRTGYGSAAGVIGAIERLERAGHVKRLYEQRRFKGLRVAQKELTAAPRPVKGRTPPPRKAFSFGKGVTGVVLPPRAALAQDVPVGAVLLEDLAPGACRYPFGDREFRYCGRPCRKGSSYCAAHHALCHRGKDEPWEKGEVAPDLRPKLDEVLDES